MADPRQYVAGSSSLVLGADSYTVPTDLDEKAYIMGQNVVCRGGIVQTRPGSRSIFCLPDGNFQGATLFTPSNGVAQIVFAVDGRIYVSAAPFTSYRRLFNLQFSSTAKYMAWAVCLKSTDFDITGNLISLQTPYSVLIMQDGLTRAAYWDGGVSGHLNPATPSEPDQTDVVPGFTETPIGLWMIWSGNRLWVSRGNQIFASDIGNPLKFTEALYLNEGRAFNLSGPCTGMIEVPSDSAGAKGFIAFTEKDGTLFASYIQDRLQWLSTPLFQNTILPNIGCVAPRSLVTQYGLNWWFSPRGFTNLNAAFRQNLSSRIDYQDNQMFASKAYLGPDLSGICTGYYENYLMCSVPSGDVLNRHTWILDQAPFEGNSNAWTGFWSGWRPIEWCRGIINGSERVFFGSVDYDGKNRIWEAMLPERTDNGCRITCYAQLRDHAAGDLNQKQYEWTKFFLSQVYGDVDLNVYVASTKGGYQLQKEYSIVSSEGQVFPDTEYSESGPFIVGNRVQSRVIRTPSNPDPSECNKCGVESQVGNMIDYAFSHLLVWSGQMGLRAYQIHMRSSPEREAGDCEEPETGPRTLNASGCSGLELLVDGQPFDTFTGFAEGHMMSANGLSVYIRRESISVISQKNADALARCAVDQIINQLTDINLDPGVFELGAAEIGEGTYVIINSELVGECPLSIAIQPVNQSVNQGGNASFSASFLNSAGGPIDYQWQVSTNGGGAWSNLIDSSPYSGVHTNALSITSAGSDLDANQYRCVASVSSCNIVSNAAVLSVIASVTADVLIVAGGGGGGARLAGGGGAGGIIQSVVTLSASTNYPIVIGLGGAGGISNPANVGKAGANGENTTAFGLTAIGGGGGGAYTGVSPGNGGSGGGGEYSTAPGGTGISGQGFAGGIGGSGAHPPASGGGGGAGAIGAAANIGIGGAGGTGIQSSISGSAIYYGGGGGGGGENAGGAGGNGGGGAGVTGDQTPGFSGIDNSGGGGGGTRGASDTVVGTGGAGGSGLVIVRYPGAAVFSGGTITTVAGDTIHTFTASGNLSPL